MSDAAENDSRLTMFVAGECNQGGRDHLEDFILIPETEENGDAFFAVFDGHGGQEAAKYARDNLWQTIKASEGFDSSNPVKMTKAIVAGFVQTHEDMWKVRDAWKKTRSGDPSTSGTTVACAIIQQDCMYIANVGDSTIVLGKTNGKPGEPEVIAEVITKDHKPEVEEEKRRIEALGGSVLPSKAGTMRVVWERKRPGKSCEVDKIPLLNMSRSLGDLWSVTKKGEYLISPKPDVYFRSLDLPDDKFIILASDGLWNVLKPQETVEIVYQLCKSGVTNKVKAQQVTHMLIKIALEQCKKQNKRADNISAILVLFAGNDIKKKDKKPFMMNMTLLLQ